MIYNCTQIDSCKLYLSTWLTFADSAMAGWFRGPTHDETSSHDVFPLIQGTMCATYKQLLQENKDRFWRPCV